MDKNSHQKYLLKQIIEFNDKRAFNEFYNQFYNKLVWYAMKITKNQEASEDVVSDLFVNFLQKKENYLKVSNIEDYLYYSVRNECIRVLKKLNTKEQSDLFLHLPSKELNPLDIVEFNELSAIIKKAINDLPPKRKEVFQLIREEGLKYKQVAAKLEISVKTIENQMTQAIAFIRERIENVSDDALNKNKLFTFLNWLVFSI